MRNSVWLGAFLATFYGAQSYAAPIVVNPGFEDPGEPDGYGAIPSWTQNPNPSGLNGFDYLSGTNGFAFDNGTTPDPTHAAFIQVFPGVATLTLQQQLSGFSPNQQYTLSYAENARNANSVPLLQVKLDGVVIVPQHADAPVGGSNPFRTVTSDPFTVTTATPLLQFIASQQAAGDDATAVFDNIQIHVVPEPTSLSLLGVAGCGLLARRRRS